MNPKLLLSAFFAGITCMSVNAQTNIFPSSGNAGIGTTSPAAKLSFKNVDATIESDGITWHNPSPLDYGIYRTPGSWTGPDYQQLKLQFATGIVLDPGTLYGKSYVDIQGGGLRVTTGAVGIGVTSLYAGATLHVKSKTASPWAVISEALTNRGIIGLNHNGNAGVLAVSYLDESGFKPLQLWTQNTPRMTIGVDGTVGIGTSSPAAKLDVAGSGGGSVDIKVNGRIQTGDASNAGGVWVGSNMFVGQTNSTSLGFYNNGAWRIITDNNGNVGIGTTSPTKKLTVNGTIYGKEVQVDLNVPGPDYVFEKNYNLSSLEEVKTYIEENKHLPEVPTAKEMEANGINVGEMNMILLKKVEELTLYMIEQNNSIKRQQEQIDILIEKNTSLQRAFKELNPKR